MHIFFENPFLTPWQTAPKIFSHTYTLFVQLGKISKQKSWTKFLTLQHAYIYVNKLLYRYICRGVLPGPRFFVETTPSWLIRGPRQIRGTSCKWSEAARLPRGKRWFLGRSGELPGKSGELCGNLWHALNLKIHSEREVPGKVQGNSAKSRELPEAQGSLTHSQPRATTVSNQKCKPLEEPQCSAVKQRGRERKGPPEIINRNFVSETGRFRMQISLWRLWKGQSTLFRRRILGQYPAAPCSHVNSRFTSKGYSSTIRVDREWTLHVHQALTLNLRPGFVKNNLQNW